jgi:hypothetical protein
MECVRKQAPSRANSLIPQTYASRTSRGQSFLMILFGVDFHIQCAEHHTHMAWALFPFWPKHSYETGLSLFGWRKYEGG